MCFKPSWEWTHEVWNMQKMLIIEKLDQSINLKSAHFIGSWCIRLLWHIGQRKQTSPCLILISLLFDDSCKGKKGTCPSDLAVVLSRRHNIHLVTLSGMSAAHHLLAFFQHPSAFSFTLTHLQWFSMDWPSQSANKQMYTYSNRYIQFHILSITATACLIPLIVCF